MLHRRDLRSDAGVTLVEMLVALAILSITGVAILAGVQLTVRTSDMHRKQGTGGAYVRNYVEAVQDWVAAGHYVACGGSGNYDPGTVGYTLPDDTNYDAGYDTPVPLAGNGATLACGADAGVQRVRFYVKSSDSRATEELVVVLRRPCAPGGPSC